MCSFLAVGGLGGKWTVHSAHTGRADHTGGEAANRPVQEGRQDRGAGAVHRQPAGPRHRGETRHPAKPQRLQAGVRRRLLQQETSSRGPFKILSSVSCFCTAVTVYFETQSP